MIAYPELPMTGCWSAGISTTSWATLISLEGHGAGREHGEDQFAAHVIEGGGQTGTGSAFRRVRSRPLRMRTREGMTIARAKGKLKGRAPKLSAPRQTHLVKLHAAGEHAIAGLAELFNVSRPTVYRVLDRAAAKAEATA
ncbi:helix-turn-helix domain-containing protein [Planosporangium sp. 12N6]|uniref:helix-turn-helix domain-containing protein n=1 Tax=Planosporangium spinosum TaxID=3402278 RepID=UPI003CF31304